MLNRTVAMGKCIDCGNAWELTENEHSYWKFQVEHEGAKYPKRCLLCRKKKREILQNENVCSKKLMKFIAQFDSGELKIEDLFKNLEQLLVDIEKLEKRAKANPNHYGKTRQASSS